DERPVRGDGVRTGPHETDAVVGRMGGAQKPARYAAPERNSADAAGLVEGAVDGVGQVPLPRVATVQDAVDGLGVGRQQQVQDGHRRVVGYTESLAAGADVEGRRADAVAADGE